MTDWVVGGIRGTIRQRSSQVFSAGSSCVQFWLGQGCPLFDVVHPAFRLPTSPSPILQGALTDCFGEVAMACDMPEACKFPSLDSCQKRYRWTHKEVDLAQHAVVGLALQVGDAEKSVQALGFESLDPFFRVSKQGLCLLTNQVSQLA